MAYYEVIVGNIGTVYGGVSKAAALKKYTTYVRQSKSESGRAGGEDVTLMSDGEPIKEHYGNFGEASASDWIGERNPRRRRGGGQVIVTDARGLARLMKNPGIRRRVRNIAEGATDGGRFIPFREASDYDPSRLSKSSLAHEDAATRAAFDLGYRKRKAAKKKAAAKKRTGVKRATKKRPAAKKRRKRNPGYVYEIVNRKTGYEMGRRFTNKRDAQSFIRHLQAGTNLKLHWTAKKVKV
jgi:hypothetical protein